MKLSKKQTQKLLRERGIWVTNACDKCGQLLGAVRWTRRGEPGEWCSAECRDGIKMERPTSAGAELATSASKQSQRRIGSRRSGRPKIHATNAEKQRSYRCRLRNRLALRNTPSERIENAQLPSAENGSHGGHVVRRTAAVLKAPTEKSQLGEMSSHARSVQEVQAPKGLGRQPRQSRTVPAFQGEL